MERLYQYVVEHGFDPEKFSIVSEAEKERWDRERFQIVLENDMKFYREAIERKRDPRKYYTFLTDHDILIGGKLLRCGFQSVRLKTGWLDDLMKEWEKATTSL